MSSFAAKPKTPSITLSITDWQPQMAKFMAPRVNDRGGKAISLFSTQTNRALIISTPLMMTFGISDFTDEKTGESDGKFNMALAFPSTEYETDATRTFLEKLKEFENFILDSAVKNCDSWFGEEMSRDVCKHSFFPFIKYQKNKDTKKIDMSKPPSIRAKVPFYENKWNVEIYNTSNQLIFPCENPNSMPSDFIVKMSSVACALQCGGVWIAGKSWGLTWKLSQCIVKPRQIVSVLGGTCHIQLSTEDKTVMEVQDVENTEVLDEDDLVIPALSLKRPAPAAETPVSTKVPAPQVVQVPAPAPVVVQVPSVSATQVVDSEDEAAPEEVPAAAAAPVVKKVIKKVIKKAA